MLFLIIIIILIFAWPYIWRWLQPHFYRWAQRRTEDYVRRAMGMPPHGRRQSRASGQSRSTYGNSTRGNAATSSRRRHKATESVIPKEYAEDVEFTEIHSYSEESVIASDGKSVSFVSESQVSEAEIIEIKKDQ